MRKGKIVIGLFTLLLVSMLALAFDRSIYLFTPSSCYSNECLLTVSNSRLRVSVDMKTGHFSVRDISKGVVWKTDDTSPFIALIQQRHGQSITESPTQPSDNPSLEFIDSEISEDKRSKSIQLTTSGSTGGSVGVNLNLWYILTLDEPQLTLKVEANKRDGTTLVKLQTGLTIEADEEGYLVIPDRTGAILPSKGPDLRVSYDLYHNAGLSMAFYGAVKKGAAYMVTLDNLYHEVEVRRVKNKTSISTIFQGRSVASTITFIPNGTYVDIAKEYKQVATERGLYNPACRLVEKLRAYPALAVQI